MKRKMFVGGRGLVTVLLGALLLVAPATVGAQAGDLADGAGAAVFLPDEHASCLGVASSFYADLGVGQRADVAHLVKEEFTEPAGLPPGARYSDFAQETLPYHCTGLE